MLRNRVESKYPKTTLSMTVIGTASTAPTAPHIQAMKAKEIRMSTGLKLRFEPWIRGSMKLPISCWIPRLSRKIRVGMKRFG